MSSYPLLRIAITVDHFFPVNPDIVGIFGMELVLVGGIGGVLLEVGFQTRDQIFESIERQGIIDFPHLFNRAGDQFLVAQFVILSTWDERLGLIEPFVEMNKSFENPLFQSRVAGV